MKETEKGGTMTTEMDSSDDYYTDRLIRSRAFQADAYSTAIVAVVKIVKAAQRHKTMGEAENDVLEAVLQTIDSQDPAFVTSRF